ncbi:MAG: hypothetical protein Q8O87_01795 [bacterium]|nr:hypothetical protein [bacterium]
MIKKFSFLLSPKIWFEPMFFSGFPAYRQAGFAAFNSRIREANT